MKSDDYFRKLDQVDPRRLRVNPPPTPTDAWIREFHKANGPWMDCECETCEEHRHFAEVWEVCALLCELAEG